MHLHNISWSYSCSSFSLQFSPGSVQDISFPSIVVRCDPNAPILTEGLLAVHGSGGKQSRFSLGGSWHLELSVSQWMTPHQLWLPTKDQDI